MNVDNTVSYLPLVEYCNSYEGSPDVFTYEICFDEGIKPQATVRVDVECVRTNFLHKASCCTRTRQAALHTWTYRHWRPGQ
ncbi:MAG: hypothetical protein IPN76_06770 [Saprospiraceae bacterium]|nr:hypothetical protein [Saprospiraceae bacterium]